MRIEVLKSKIHRVKITQAELHYVGSIAIDEDLMDASNIIEGEKVTVVNINNGERLDTTPAVTSHNGCISAACASRMSPPK
jgi:aspartate 1-decarboxylase